MKMAFCSYTLNTVEEIFALQPSLYQPTPSAPLHGNIIFDQNRKSGGSHT